MPNDLVVSSERLRTRLGYTEVLDEPRRIADLVGGLRLSRPREPTPR